MLIVNIFTIAPLSRLHYCAVIIVESATPEYREMLAFDLQPEVSKEHRTAVTSDPDVFSRRLDSILQHCQVPTATKVTVVAH